MSRRNPANMLILCSKFCALTPSQSWRKPGYTEKEKPSNEIAAILDVLFPVIPDDENQKIEVLFEKVDISGWHLRGRQTQQPQHENALDGEKVNLLV